MSGMCLHSHIWELQCGEGQSQRHRWHPDGAETDRPASAHTLHTHTHCASLLSYLCCLDCCEVKLLLSPCSVSTSQADSVDSPSFLVIVAGFASSLMLALPGSGLRLPPPPWSLFLSAQAPPLFSHTLFPWSSAQATSQTPTTTTTPPEPRLPPPPPMDPGQPCAVDWPHSTCVHRRWTLQLT